MDFRLPGGSLRQRSLLGGLPAVLNECLLGDCGFVHSQMEYAPSFLELRGAVAGFDDKVVGSIEKMLPLRDDFVDFTFTLFKYRDSVDLDQLHGFWEKLIPFTFRPESVQSWATVDFDNYRFFNYELMLSFIATLLQLRKHREAGFFLHTQYFYRNDTCELKQNGIEAFNRHVRSLDEFRNNRLGLRRVSVTADLIKARATRKDLSFGEIREADLVIHYVIELRGGRFDWFPRTSVFGGRGSGIELFERMVSRRHFDKIKAILGVDTVDELKALIDQYVTQNSGIQRGFSGMFDYDIRPLENVIDRQTIATIP